MSKKKPKRKSKHLVPLSEAMRKPKKKAKAKRGATTRIKAVKDKPVKEKKLSCLDAAAQVLKGASAPMNCKALVDEMTSCGLWKSDAPTPAQTLSAAIQREMKSANGDSRFKRSGRGVFEHSGKEPATA